MMPRLPLIGMPSYGLLVAAGFVAGLLLAWVLAPRRGLERGDVQDVAVWSSLWAIIGAKALLIVLEPRAFLSEPWALLFQGGVFYGGLIVGAAAGVMRARRLGLDPWAVADVLAPCLALAHAFGRVGCFLAGCCYGSACDAPWSVSFTDPLSAPVLAGIDPLISLHPTQLYEALGNAVLVAVLVALLSRRLPAGGVWWTYVGGYALLRGGIEALRGDERGHIGPLSTSQVIAMALLVVSVLALWRLRGRAAPATPGEPGG